MLKKTLVLGASDNPERYSNRAIKMLLEKKFDVVALGNKEAVVSGITIHKGFPDFDNIHTVTMYLNQNNQAAYYDYLFSLKPSRIIFNPGAENYELEELCNKRKIETVNACTLVMLSLGNY